MARNYSNNAVETDLTAGVDATATSLTVGSVTGWPAPPFTIIVDGDTVREEPCLVTAMTGLTLTVQRGFDVAVQGAAGTGMAHSAGATVVHAAVADDFRRAAVAADAIAGKQGLTVGGTWAELL